VQNVIKSEEEFDSVISRIHKIILLNQGNLPKLGTPGGKDLEMLISLAYEYVKRTGPAGRDPMEVIMNRIERLGKI
jgi:hypothetical protein